MRVLALFVLAACAEPPAAPVRCSDPGVACLLGEVQTLLGAGHADVELCILESPEIPCQTTTGDGLVEFVGLPLDTDLTVSLRTPDSGPDNPPLAYAIHTSALHWRWVQKIVPASMVRNQADALGVTMNPARGNLMFHTATADPDPTKNWHDVAGATVVIAPDPGVDAYYLNGLFAVDEDATKTSGIGVGGAMNLMPGRYELTAVSPGGICNDQLFSWAWDGDALPFEIRAGYTTYVNIGCPEAP